MKPISETKLIVVLRNCPSCLSHFQCSVVCVSFCFCRQTERDVYNSRNGLTLLYPVIAVNSQQILNPFSSFFLPFYYRSFRANSFFLNFAICYSPPPSFVLLPLPNNPFPLAPFQHNNPCSLSPLCNCPHFTSCKVNLFLLICRSKCTKMSGLNIKLAVQRFTRHSENKIRTFGAVVCCECSDAHSAV